MPIKGLLTPPRGFSAAPIDSVGNYIVHTERQLIAAIREASSGNLESTGVWIRVVGTLKITQTIKIPSKVRGLFIECGRATFIVSSGAGVTTLFDIAAPFCTLDGVQLGQTDGYVFNGTAFNIMQTAKHCRIMNATIRATTFAVGNGATCSSILASHWLSAANGTWRGYSSQDGWDIVADVATTATPITVPANTWTALTNDDAGALSVDAYLPFGVTKPWSTSSQAFSFPELIAGDIAEIRIDFSITPDSNNAILEFRFFSASFPLLDISTLLPSLKNGSGVAHNVAQTFPFVFPLTGAQLGTLVPQVRSDNSSTVVVDFFGTQIRRLGL